MAMNLMISVLLTALVVNVVQGEECERNGASCPVYEVVANHTDHEERLYPSLVWISTSALSKSRSDVSRMLIKRLYGYLGGANDRGVQIDMMVPVRTAKVVTDHGANNYTMSIAVGPLFQEDPPHPISDLVSMQREPPTTYVTRSFGGMIRNENEWDRQSELLKSSVSGEEVDTSFYFWCVYDSPWTETDRLNEVWMRKTASE